MELIMISSSKLKIMLSADDMAKYALDADIDYSDKKTRRIFKVILNEAYEKTGFNAESEKLFIQLYPSKKGGCEVYITKIDDCNESDSTPPSSKLSTAKPASVISERSTGIISSPKRRVTKEHRIAYSFRSSADMLAVCRRLLAANWCGQSSAFSDENKRFYIILKERSSSETNRLDHFAFIGEYGNFEDHNFITKYLSEHGKCLCNSKAVEKLGKL